MVNKIGKMSMPFGNLITPLQNSFRNLFNNKFFTGLKLEDITYTNTKYKLIFRMHHKSAIISYSPQEAVKENILVDLNPFDGYCVGIIHALSVTKVEVLLDNFVSKLPHIIHPNTDCKFKLIECDFSSGTITIKLNSTHICRIISVNDFIKSAYMYHILYFITAKDAYDIGYFITDYILEAA